MNDKILTKNPDPNKKGISIDLVRYDLIKAEIFATLQQSGPLSAMQLVKEMDKRLGGDSKIGFSIGWYTTAIRLDLEARNQIAYDRSAKKPVITLVNQER